MQGFVIANKANKEENLQKALVYVDTEHAELRIKSLDFFGSNDTLGVAFHTLQGAMQAFQEITFRNRLSNQTGVSQINTELLEKYYGTTFFRPFKTLLL